MKWSLPLAAVPVLALSSLTGCGQRGDPADEVQCETNLQCTRQQRCVEGICETHILGRLEAEGDFGAFLQLVADAGLYEYIATRDAYTFFPPTNDAYLTLSNECRVALSLDRDALEAVARNHMGLALGRIDRAGLERAARAEATVQMESFRLLPVRQDAGAVTVGGVTVADEALEALDAVAHPLSSGVLMPDDLPPDIMAACQR